MTILKFMSNFLLLPLVQTFLQEISQITKQKITFAAQIWLKAAWYLTIKVNNRNKTTISFIKQTTSHLVGIKLFKRICQLTFLFVLEMAKQISFNNHQLAASSFTAEKRVHFEGGETIFSSTFENGSTLTKTEVH